MHKWVRAGLEALIAREAGKRLAALGGSQPGLKNIPPPALVPMLLVDTSIWIRLPLFSS